MEFPGNPPIPELTIELPTDVPLEVGILLPVYCVIVSDGNTALEDCPSTRSASPSDLESLPLL